MKEKIIFHIPDFQNLKIVNKILFFIFEGGRIFLSKGLSSSSSLSYRAASTDIPDLLSPLLPIVHLLRQVFRATSRILT